MIYQKSITTQPNRSKTNPLLTRVQLCYGLLYKLNVYFPPGSTGLAGLAIIEENTQIYPIGSDEFFVGDNLLWTYDDTRYITVSPYEFVIKTYNEDQLFEHLIIVSFGIISDDKLMLRYIPESIIDNIKKYENIKNNELVKKRIKDIQNIKQIVTGEV